jgi:hypothetical protein
MAHGVHEPACDCTQAAVAMDGYEKSPSFGSDDRYAGSDQGCDRLLGNSKMDSERHLVYASMEAEWKGCKSLYAQANCEPQDLGQFEYVRSSPVACRLVLIKKRSKGRHRTTVHGKAISRMH